MTELEIVLPSAVNETRVETIVDEVCAAEKLHATMKSTLNQYPGCVHWHFKQGKARGVLEVTWWPSNPDKKQSRQQESAPPRLWLSIHGNRMADWIEPLMPRLKLLIEERLKDSA